MIELNDIFFAYDNTQVLKGINLKVEKGEIISIVGASGAGKTTLLHILGTLEKPQKGDYLINNNSVIDLDSNQLAKFRNLEVGFIFQFHNLLAEFTAFENICLPGYISKRKRLDVEKRATELLEILGISDKKNQKPNQLSGGEQQRIAIARALINSPSIILADEPSGNLDSKNAENLHELFIKLNKELNQTFIIVTHNKHLASMTDRSLEMIDGKFIA
jgi:lipoprotein-releasing system ATP-binding protein|tara:strand:- start:162 stop:815 length:654 start_codon:yes stop_codon:yes gene_type:complete